MIGAIPDQQLQDLLQDLHQVYGLDFRNYAMSSLARRLRFLIGSEKVSSVDGLRRLLASDPGAVGRLVDALSVSVTSMFRDPGFFSAFRRVVVPRLRNVPLLRVWDAGCASGEEAWSLAILLAEEGLYDRARIYATDINPKALSRARPLILPLAAMRSRSHNYLASGGSGAFADYYATDSRNATLSHSLGRNIVFALHNVATDRPFNAFHVVVCRNVLIYFGAELKRRVHEQMFNSLLPGGVLCLGPNEVLSDSPYADRFRVLSESQRIYARDDASFGVE